MLKTRRAYPSLSKCSLIPWLWDHSKRFEIIEESHNCQRQGWFQEVGDSSRNWSVLKMHDGYGKWNQLDSLSGRGRVVKAID